MTKSNSYQPSAKEQAFLDSVHNGKYDRQIVVGISKFLDGSVPDDMRSFYTKDELEAMFSRRDIALAYIDELIAEHGEDKVMVFP